MSQSIQYALVFPALMMSTLGIIQAGVWIHGRQVLSEAANAAADASRSADAGPAAGDALARHITDVGGVRDVVVAVNRGRTEVRATVTGTIPLFFDLDLSRITASAVAPVERVTTP
jgi:Flp pilus assembly protein TadG